MKKTLILTMAVMIMASLGAVEAAPLNLDTLEKTASSKRFLQKNYLRSLKLRYENMYNRKQMGSDYHNAYTQLENIKDSQKAAHTMGGTKSILSRTGTMEVDKERIQEKTPYQVKAVNSKSVFLKRAMDYYVYGGAAGSDIMEAGNIDMKNNKVSRRKMMSAMYKKQLGQTTLETRELQKSMVGPKYENSKKRPSSYKTGDFISHMISPFTSLKWLDEID